MLTREDMLAWREDTNHGPDVLQWRIDTLLTALENADQRGEESKAAWLQASDDAGTAMQRADEQERRSDALAADLARAIASRADFEARLDRITRRAERWAVMSHTGSETSYDDPNNVFRDCASIVLHLAAGGTFPDPTDSPGRAG